jgi:hypothetical protein
MDHLCNFKFIYYANHMRISFYKVLFVIAAIVLYSNNFWSMWLYIYH